MLCQKILKADANALLREENQVLRDEINRLKGEQGKPDIRGQSKGDNTGNSNHSSEGDRKKGGKGKNKGKSKKDIIIDRRVTIPLDKTQLPNDLKFKGFETRIIQDIKIITDNVEFKLEVYYSPSLKKTFIAPMPTEYQGGEFSPDVTRRTLQRELKGLINKNILSTTGATSNLTYEMQVDSKPDTRHYLYLPNSPQ